MPTISFSYRDFQQLLGKKLPIEEFKDLAILYAKAEVEEYNKEKDEAKMSLDDTNLPYMWCAEGLARFFRGVLGIEKGLPKFKTEESKYEIIVEPAVKKLRPSIASFIAEGKQIDKYLLEQLIQLQEKFCESYGRRRQKVSIGLYSHRKIKFPVHYKAALPESVKFEPLEMSEKIKLNEILEKHPKGRQYGWIIKEFERYPLLMDSNGEVLSLIPIINSNLTGRLAAGDKELMFEATGTDEEAVNLAANIFAQNLYERGFKISSVTINRDGKKTTTPHKFAEKTKISESDIEKLTGLKLSPAKTKELLERARYDVSGNTVTIPDYRRDILHPFDIIEDAAIMYGFNNIESEQLTSYTTGATTQMNEFADAIRGIATGLGFQEILSPILSNKAVLEEKMETTNTGIVEIENIMSETFSAARSWLTPIMLEVLSKNMHNDFPQRIFEQGTATTRKGNRISDSEKIALATSHTNADFTEIKQCLNVLMKSLGLNYALAQLNHPSFITGRCGTIKAKGKEIGIIGEVSPKVLTNWQLEMPVSAMEIDLTELKRIISTS